MLIAQHHGRKTRLLDVSHNPCVALFSACDSHDPAGKPLDNDMDGRLHLFAVPKELIKPFDSDTVSIVGNFAKLDRGYQNLLLGKTAEDSQKEDPGTPIRYLYSEALRHPIPLHPAGEAAFRGENRSQRLPSRVCGRTKAIFRTHQSAKRRLYHFCLSLKIRKKEIQGRIRDVPVYEHEVPIVPGKKKGSFLRELSLLDFTRETLHPSLDEVANRITHNYL